MNLEYKNLLPTGFHPSSRVWIYQSNRCFTLSEALQAEELLEAFVRSWKSHGASVKGFAQLFFGQFIIIIADETNITIGGCSTDSSVRVIKEIETRFKTTLLDRQQLAFVINEKIEILPYKQVPYALEHGFINGDTLYFNNTIQQLNDLQEHWIVPVQNSWLGNKLQLQN
jgi:hypothetical protein